MSEAALHTDLREAVLDELRDLREVVLRRDLDKDTLYTYAEAAGRMGMSERWVQQEVAAGRLQAVEYSGPGIGRRRPVRITEQAIQDYWALHLRPKRPVRKNGT